jgi:hypothetical protein
MRRRDKGQRAQPEHNKAAAQVMGANPGGETPRAQPKKLLRDVWLT